MKVPIWIYFDKETGQVLQVTGNFEDMWLERYDSIEEQIRKHSVLSERNRNTFDVLELPYGAHAQEFAECNGYRVNVETKELEFSYPDPNEPNAPQEFGPPLTEQIEELQKENATIKMAMAEISEVNELENEKTKLALFEIAEMMTGGLG